MTPRQSQRAKELPRCVDNDGIMSVGCQFAASVQLSA
jgi:hypothetical protein